ncbi:sodium:solute symporter [Alkalimonas collagenimarina]|uniref:Sodium:solute symporter n=1 Tax=Alkalimonas collagenimarina TaxID=400390 RepID=A0ABT9GZ52_9GAMM|nr:sodium:solute symporter [Alkalimonas collagenimarina]MDP4536321.1 sodium:solute symporter [Alkalimonas collagenimarina]
MTSQFDWPDWLAFFIYFALMSFTGWYFSQRKSNSARDYFLAGNSMPIWMVAVSVLATSQSAATFLGGPDQGFRGDFSYLMTNIGAFIAAYVVAVALIPRFYQYKVGTAYELLEQRFGSRSKTQASLLYLFGRVFASGARLYMAGIAVSMILFADIAASSVIASIVLLAMAGLAYSFVGGIRSVIYSDVIQCIVYVSAALAVIVSLLYAIPADFSQIIDALAHPHDRELSKLTLFDFRLDFTSAGVFTFWSALIGFTLLNIAAFGLDQDITQRMLSCKDAKSGSKALLWSIIMVIPVMLLFIFIGMLLYIFYLRPDLMLAEGGSTMSESFSGEKITVFMSYVLNEMPTGVRGLVTVGVVAAALSTINSGLNAMSSVLVQDLYRPWLEKKKRQRAEKHYVLAGQAGMTLSAVALSAMAIICFYWQKSSDMPLLAFALSVMVFSYSGLLGVYFTALFTNRGSKTSVTWAFIAGFLVPLALQPYTLQAYLPADWRFDIGFTWQLCIGTLIAFSICVAGRPCREKQQQWKVVEQTV